MFTVTVALSNHLTWTFAFREAKKAREIRDTMKAAMSTANGQGSIDVVDDFGQEASIDAGQISSVMFVSLDARDAIMVDQYARDFRARMQAERLAMAGVGNNALLMPTGPMPRA